MHFLCTKDEDFPFRISSVNVTKSADPKLLFGHIYLRNPRWKTSLFVQCSGWNIWLRNTDSCIFYTLSTHSRLISPWKCLFCKREDWSEMESENLR